MPIQPLQKIEWRLGLPTDEWADVAIYIDGLSLIDLVHQYEELHSYIPAGSYGWAPVRWMSPLSRHFLGEPHWPTDGVRALLLVCHCTELGCWDFEGRITITAEYVEWSDFEQAHRRPGSSGGHWDYSGFGPFRFDRAQYEIALAAVSR